MARMFPLSLVFFVATGLVYLLQMIPVIGIFLMFMLAMFWSVLLINVGMIGIAVEALSGRVYRAWALVPFVFYAGYFAVAGSERMAFETLRSTYDAANQHVLVPFDQTRHSLVFENSDARVRLTPDYDLNVAYSANTTVPEGYLATRLIGKETCDLVRSSMVEPPNVIRASGIRDGGDVTKRRSDNRFCTVTLNEKPTLPAVTVKKETVETNNPVLLSRLPVRTTTTMVTMPDGNTFDLRGGVASPLTWFPMPIMGCALNSAAPSWECGMVFWRDSFTPIISGDTRYGRETALFARALGLNPVAPADRQAGSLPIDLSSRFAKIIKDLKGNKLQGQIEDIRALVQAPTSRDLHWNFDVLADNKTALSESSEDIIAALEAVAFYEGENQFMAHDNGRMLIEYLLLLPDDQFAEVETQIAALLAQAEADHWMWEITGLLDRLEATGVKLVYHQTL